MKKLLFTLLLFAFPALAAPSTTQVPVTLLAPIAANSLYANFTGAQAVPTIVTLSGCAGTGNFLNFTSGLGIGCAGLDTLTFGTHLTGTSYNGTANVTISTDAASANTVGTLVARDASGNFSAGTITASLTGAASLDMPLTGGTFTGEVITLASATGGAGFNLPQGTAPTSPANGDLWLTSGGLFARVNGVTEGPFTANTGTVTSIATTSPITGGTITSTGTIGCATCGVTGSPLSQFASTTSAQLAGVLSDETGTGSVVFNTSPTLLTPAIKGSSTGVTTIGSANASASNFTATLPAATDTIVELAQTQTLSNKTLTSPTITTSFVATGLVTNADLVNQSTTVNGQTCTLGSTCTISASAGTITVGTTTIASGTTANLLYNNAGTLGNETIASILTAGSGISISGTTNATITSTRQFHSQFFSTTGANTFTTPVGTTTSTIYRFLLTAPGGGSAGSTSGANAGGGGGAGESCLGTFTGLAAGTNVTITLGTGGTAGTNTGGTGGTGGTSTLAATGITTATANGGIGGVNGTGTGALGGSGGCSGYSDIPGGAADFSAAIVSGSFALGSGGGASYWGGGGAGTTNGAGHAGPSCGTGAGGSSGASAAQVGAAGANGCAELQWVNWLMQRDLTPENDNHSPAFIPLAA